MNFSGDIWVRLRYSRTLLLQRRKYKLKETLVLLLKLQQGSLSLSPEQEGRFYWLAFLLQVSSLFKDGTIGSDINIVVVSLLLLEEDPVSRLTETTPDNRCSINMIRCLCYAFAVGLDHQSPCRPVSQQFLSMAVRSLREGRQTPRSCCSAHRTGHLLLEKWTLWHTWYEQK